MAIDTSIYNNIQPVKLENPMNSLAQMMQLQQGQQANQLNQMKMDEYSRTKDRQNKLIGLSQGWGADTTDEQRSAALKGSGYFDEADKLDKGVVERSKAKAEGQFKMAESLKNYVGVQKDLSTAVMAQPTLENATAALNRAAQYHKMLGFGDLDVSQELASLQGMDSEQIKQWAAGHSLSADKLLPKLVNFTAGNREVNQSIDPVTGLPTETGSTVIGQSADNKATNDTSIRNNNNTVSAARDSANATREAARTTGDATRAAAQIQTGFTNEQGLRKEFEGLPEVKNYKQAYPAYAAIKDATGRNTTQSDINIVYGLAKLYDPNSVVREGEYATVANSPSIPEKVKGYAQYLAGGGRLSEETKKQIIAEATGRIGTYKAEATKARNSYEGIAKKRGMDPSTVFADMGDMTSTPAAKDSQANPHSGKTDAQIKAELGL